MAIVALKLRNHPSKQALLVYAENLVDNGAAIDRTMASHVLACPQCKSEVEAIQASFTFAASAPELEPATDMAASILMASKATRTEMRRRTTPWRMVLRGVQYGVSAAAMLVVTGLTFTAFLGSWEQESVAPTIERPAPMVVSPGSSPEAMRQAAVEVAAEVHTLSEAVVGTQRSAPTPEALGQLREVLSRDDDIAAAVSALQRNPNSVRATHVVHATLKQQAESLRNLYVEGGSL